MTMPAQKLGMQDFFSLNYKCFQGSRLRHGTHITTQTSSKSIGACKLKTHSQEDCIAFFMEKLA